MADANPIATTKEILNQLKQEKLFGLCYHKLQQKKFKKKSKTE